MELLEELYRVLKLRRPGSAFLSKREREREKKLYCAKDILLPWWASYKLELRCEKISTRNLNEPSDKINFNENFETTSIWEIVIAIRLQTLQLDIISIDVHVHWFILFFFVNQVSPCISENFEGKRRNNEIGSVSLHL